MEPSLISLLKLSTDKRRFILWHIDLLLGNDSEINKTTAIAIQQHRKYATLLELLHNNESTAESGVFYGSPPTDQVEFS
jgi:hypothetical protein